MLPQRRQHALAEPRRMAELEPPRPLRPQRPGNRFQPWQVFLERGWKLEEERAQLRAERSGDAAECLDEVPGTDELGIVRDAARRLQREAELRRDLSGPAGKDLLARHPVEGVVDFNR